MTASTLRSMANWRIASLRAVINSGFFTIWFVARASVFCAKSSMVALAAES